MASKQTQSMSNMPQKGMMPNMSGMPDMLMSQEMQAMMSQDMKGMNHDARMQQHNQGIQRSAQKK